MAAGEGGNAARKSRRFTLCPGHGGRGDAATAGSPPGVAAAAGAGTWPRTVPVPPAARCGGARSPGQDKNCPCAPTAPGDSSRAGGTPRCVTG